MVCGLMQAQKMCLERRGPCRSAAVARTGLPHLAWFHVRPARTFMVLDGIRSHRTVPVSTVKDSPSHLPFSWTSPTPPPRTDLGRLSSPALRPFYPFVRFR